ncbi:MAG: DivIVA domain-containing protein [Myxococcales bacterium]|nr:DivIVA domain-containing protein [Myxococcales bacterium]MCB9650783.1 DivIVA domain-containing protein [Deltaproteobacteria bacterium]
MKLTPLDIQQQQFRTAFWGFDKREVDAFLDVLANDFEQLVRENNALREEIKRKDAELLDHRERERTLKETMITATRITEDIKQNARKESEIVVAQAEAQAEQIIQNAHTRLVRIMEDIDELKRQKAQFEAGLRSIIASHTKLMDAMTEREPMGAEMHSLVKRRQGPVQSDLPVERVEDTDDDLLLAPRGGDR